jgi:hypothetical protein
MSFDSYRYVWKCQFNYFQASQAFFLLRRNYHIIDEGDNLSVMTCSYWTMPNTIICQDFDVLHKSCSIQCLNKNNRIDLIDEGDQESRNDSQPG